MRRLNRDLSGPVVGAGVTAAGTATFTNKTFDATDATNVLTTTTKIWLPTASCQDNVATLLWDLGTPVLAVAACSGTAGGALKGVTLFDPDTTVCLRNTIQLPTDFAGAIDVRYVWYSPLATAGDVVWCTQLGSASDGESMDPTLLSQSTSNCMSDPNKTTANLLNYADDPNITATGVAAGEMLHLRTCRDATSSVLSDTFAGDASLLGVELTIRRSQ